MNTNSITEQFLDFANVDTEYAYNANGAMTKDLNKGISKIEYNLLNLPQQVDILSPLAEARNAYSYSADGVKLRVVKKYNSNFNTSPVIGSAVNVSSMDVTKTTDYVSGKIIENNVLDRISVDGGYIQDGVYYFYETDHLGSNRTTLSQEDEVMERNDYYPYGMQMAHNQLVNQASGSDNKRKFSGKELDVMHGLNLYDFSARNQDPTLGRFTTVDPLAEKKPWLSPYVYCSDNPVNRVDPDGRDDIFDKNGNFIKRIENKTDYILVANSDNKTTNITNFEYSKTQTANRNMLSNVATYYANEAGINQKQVGIEDISSKTQKIDGIAVTDPKTRDVSIVVKDGKLNEVANTGNNLINSFVHESVHVADGKTGSMAELKAIQTQVKDPSFEKTTSIFQSGMMGYAVSNANKAIGKETLQTVMPYINNINNSKSAYGIYYYPPDPKNPQLPSFAFGLK